LVDNDRVTWRNAKLIYRRFIIWSFLVLPPSEWLQYKMPILMDVVHL